jgi:hypothetical protein
MTMAEPKCANCGYVRSEHHHGGACYGLCGGFIEPSEKLFYDLFSHGRWIGMAEGVDEDDAKRMAARCLPALLGGFTLVRWYGWRNPDNCKASGGNVPDPKPEPPFEGRWRPIHTAPNERVILYSPPENLSDDPEQEYDIRIARPAEFCWATHWMAVPAPPAETGSGAAL